MQNTSEASFLPEICQYMLKRQVEGSIREVQKAFSFHLLLCSEFPLPFLNNPNPTNHTSCANASDLLVC